MTYYEELDETVIKCTSNGRISWKKVGDIMNELYPEERGTTNKWRMAWRKYHDSGYKATRSRDTQKSNDKRYSRVTLEERIIPLLNTKKTLSYLIERLDASEQEIKSTMVDLSSRGYNIETWTENLGFGNKVYFQIGKKINQLYDYPEFQLVGDEMKIAIISDTHFGSNQEANFELNWFYDYAIKQGVTEFFHAGDVSDGYYKQRDTSIFEQHSIGVQQQLDYVVNNYPRRDNVTTYFITGNHDITHLRNGGANFGKMVGDLRDDMVYLGHNFAKVWLSPEVDLNLVHPTDGSTYAVTHKIQKYIDKAKGNKSAKIIAMGHYHKAAWVYYKDIHGLVMPSFQHQTQFMSDNNLESKVGGYIVTVKTSTDGKLVSLLPEFVDLGDLHE